MSACFRCLCKFWRPEHCLLYRSSSLGGHGETGLLEAPGTAVGRRAVPARTGPPSAHSCSCCCCCSSRSSYPSSPPPGREGGVPGALHPPPPSSNAKFEPKLNTISMKLPFNTTVAVRRPPLPLKRHPRPPLVHCTTHCTCNPPTKSHGLFSFHLIPLSVCTLCSISRFCSDRWNPINFSASIK